MVTYNFQKVGVGEIGLGRFCEVNQLCLSNDSPLLDPSHKYPTMHHFVTELCTHLYFIMVHCGMWHGCIVWFVQRVHGYKIWTNFTYLIKRRCQMVLNGKNGKWWMFLVISHRLVDWPLQLHDWQQENNLLDLLLNWLIWYFVIGLRQIDHARHMLSHQWFEAHPK